MTVTDPPVNLLRRIIPQLTIGAVRLDFFHHGAAVAGLHRHECGMASCRLRAHSAGQAECRKLKIVLKFSSTCTTGGSGVTGWTPVTVRDGSGVRSTLQPEFNNLNLIHRPRIGRAHDATDTG